MYRVVSFLQLAQMSTRGDQTCLDYIIDHQTDIDYSIEHQTSIVYSMDTSNLCCLQYWHIIINSVSSMCSYGKQFKFDGSIP
jgi:hypothetical protein